MTALDQFGDPIYYNGTVHFTSSDGQASLPGNTTLTNGTGSFSVTLKTAGSETLTATDTVTTSITGTSGSHYRQRRGSQSLCRQHRRRLTSRARPSASR